jgi:glycosylphosphatidylinositol deacylase
MCLIFALIFLFVPWQVAYLGCWVIHLYTCASLNQADDFPGSLLTPGDSVIPLIRVRDADADTEGGDEYSRIHNRESQQASGPNHQYRINNRNHSMYILLLMTWLLPLATPVLAVWVRTLFTAGLTTPFDGDHNFLNVAPFLVLVDFASWNTGPLFERQRRVIGFFLRSGVNRSPDSKKYCQFGGVSQFLPAPPSLSALDTLTVFLTPLKLPSA